MKTRMRAAIVLMATTCLVVCTTHAQSKYSGIPVEHHAYTLGEGVATKEVTFYSDGTACWAQLFFPTGFSTERKTPAVVIAHGWTGTSASLLKYGNRFAERGFVAMVIDYRGWGNSDGFVSMVDRVKTTDDQRFTETSTKVQIKRTRLHPMKQVEDIRNAVSYIQGEAGVDPDRIGLWGSSYAGGHVLTVASMDARISAVVSQVTGLSGYGMREGPSPMRPAVLADAIKRAREGQGGEFKTGFSQPRFVDIETRQLSSEYRPYLRVKHIPESVAVLFLLAENDELINNERSGEAAFKVLKGPKKLVVYPEIGHFDIYIEENFEKASNESADWYAAHLGETH